MVGLNNNFELANVALGWFTNLFVLAELELPHNLINTSFAHELQPDFLLVFVELGVELNLPG